MPTSHDLAALIESTADLQRLREAAGGSLPLDGPSCFFTDAGRSLGRETTVPTVRAADDDRLDPTRSELLALAGRLRDDGAQPIVIDRLEINVSATVGGSELSFGSNVTGATADQLGAIGFDATTPDRTTAQHILERELVTAIERDEFELYFQPVANTTGRGVGAHEALMRWNHPTRGCLTPNAFLDTAISIGLAGELGDWTIEQAALASRRLFDAGHNPTVGINLFSDQVNSSSLVTSMQRAVDAVSMPITALAVEVSEETLMRDAAAARATIDDLRAHGIRVAIDDFGTGYSNLMRLRQLQVDFLKIDRSIIKNVDTDEVSRTLLEIVMALASALGVCAVAEGIESEAQAQVLREVNCRWMQGFHIGRPMPLGKALVAPADPLHQPA